MCFWLSVPVCVLECSPKQPCSQWDRSASVEAKKKKKKESRHSQVPGPHQFSTVMQLERDSIFINWLINTISLLTLSLCTLKKLPLWLLNPCRAQRQTNSTQSKVVRTDCYSAAASVKTCFLSSGEFQSEKQMRLRKLSITQVLLEFKESGAYRSEQYQNILCACFW